MGMRSRPQQLEGPDPPTAPVLWAQAEGFPLSPECGSSGEAQVAPIPTASIPSRPGPHLAPGWMCLCYPNQDTNLLDWPGEVAVPAPGTGTPALRPWGRVWYNPVCLGSQRHSAGTGVCQELLVGRSPKGPTRRGPGCMLPPALWGQPWGGALPLAAWVVGGGRREEAEVNPGHTSLQGSPLAVLAWSAGHLMGQTL